MMSSHDDPQNPNTDRDAGAATPGETEPAQEMPAAAGPHVPPGAGEHVPYSGPGVPPAGWGEAGYVPPPPPPRIPRAGTAFLAFLTFFGAQLVGGLIVGVIAGIQIAASGIDVSSEAALQRAMEGIIGDYIVYSLIPITVFSGLAVLFVARRMARDVMTVAEPAGVGWGNFSAGKFLVGLVAGIGVAAVYIALASTVFVNYQQETKGPLSEMLNSGGLATVMVGVVAVLCAPLIEEFLFRGVMLAGLTRSFGLPAAVVLTTALFVAVHIPELMHYWPGTIGVGGMAVIAVALRIKLKSLGPAIGVHLGYNGALIALVAVSFLPENLL